jgi:flagellar biosynthesis protein FlhF
MRLKVYHAPNTGAAMAMVRAELGPDALILASRSVEDGIEITAATECNPSAPEPTPDQARHAALRWHGLPSPLAERLANGDLISAVERELRFARLPISAGAAPLLLVGPPGAGKTLTTARLATRFVLSRQPAHVITADGRRAGAAEQLAAYTRLLSLTLIVADTPPSLARALGRRPEGAPVLIDTPGLNPADPADRDFLRECQAATGGTIALVLPTGLDPADAHDIAHGFKHLGATLLIATRLDQSRRLGGILAAAETGLALTEAGIGPGAADGLRVLTPEFLAERLAEAMNKPAAAPPPQPPSPKSALELLVRARSEHQRSVP